MPNVGPLEIIVVLIVVLIIFGPKRLPELGRSLGHGIREFKGSLSGDHDDDDTPKPGLSSGDSTPAGSEKKSETTTGV
jgi:sec-independent protein translocase protein TatA